MKKLISVFNFSTSNAAQRLVKQRKAALTIVNFKCFIDHFDRQIKLLIESRS